MEFHPESQTEELQAFAAPEQGPPPSKSLPENPPWNGWDVFRLAVIQFVIPLVVIPTLLSTWFGLFATWEGIGLQIASAIFVIGSYYWAEYLNHRPRHPARKLKQETVDTVQPV